MEFGRRKGSGPLRTVFFGFLFSFCFDRVEFGRRKGSGPLRTVIFGFLFSFCFDRAEFGRRKGSGSAAAWCPGHCAGNRAPGAAATRPLPAGDGDTSWWRDCRQAVSGDGYLEECRGPAQFGTSSGPAPIRPAGKNGRTGRNVREQRFTGEENEFFFISASLPCPIPLPGEIWLLQECGDRWTRWRNCCAAASFGWHGNDKVGPDWSAEHNFSDEGTVRWAFLTDKFLQTNRKKFAITGVAEKKLFASFECQWSYEFFSCVAWTEFTA